ncbi:MAG: hypothetical protein H6807_07965 [Planctomycetes bacterium]|nr:hypothetical protein [Planctomycetota bacterium]
MKPFATIFISVVLACVASIGLVTWQGNGGDGDGRLASSDVLEARMSRLLESVKEIQERQERLEGQLGRALADTDAAAVRDLRVGFDQEIAKLREEVAGLGEKLAAARSGAGVEETRAAIAAALDSEEAAAALAAYVEERVKAQVRKQANPVRQFAPMARMGFNQNLRRVSRQLQLDPEQTRRLTESATAAFDKNMPAIEVLMDRDAATADKEKAAMDIETTMSDVSRDAESYMSSEQHQKFLEEQQKQMDQLNRLRDAFGAPPATPGSATQGASGRTAGSGN